MNSKKYALFVGRWQPFHNGHKFIIDKALEQGPVCIGIRLTPITEKDPYTAEARRIMIRSVYPSTDNVKIIDVPDIRSVNIGRKVGYDVVRYDAPENIKNISATQIRDAISSGDSSWREKVPEGIAEYLTKTIDKETCKVIWMTGLSGTGKSTLSDRLRSFIPGSVIPLDGDIIRDAINSGLGFSREGRRENIKRIGALAKHLVDHGSNVIVSCISPYEEDRNASIENIGRDRVILIHLDCDLDILKERDPKGLYKKAMAGEIKNFTGIDDPYEVPTNADLKLDTGKLGIEECIDIIHKCLDDIEWCQTEMS